MYIHRDGQLIFDNFDQSGSRGANDTLNVFLAINSGLGSGNIKLTDQSIHLLIAFDLSNRLIINLGFLHNFVSLKRSLHLPKCGT